MELNMDKAKLLDLIQIEWAFFQRTLALLDEEQMVGPSVYDDLTVKDIQAHIMAWEQRILDWMEEAERGQPPQIPAPDHTWDDIDAFNEQTYQQNKDRSLTDIRNDSNRTHEQVVHLITTLSEEDLFDLVRFKGSFREPPWRLIAGNTYEHYAEHSAEIREWLNRLHTES